MRSPLTTPRAVDVAIQTDSCHPSAHFEDLNSGFVFTRASANGKAFVQRVIELMLSGKSNYLRQQIALNRAAREMAPEFFAPLDAFCDTQCRDTHDACFLERDKWPPRADSLRVLVLDPAQWLTGRGFFHWSLHKARGAAPPAIVHANWVRGHKAKRDMLNRAKLWVVDEHLGVHCNTSAANVTECTGCQEMGSIVTR